MKKMFDGVLWFLFLFFIIPTMLIIASWNSYPGDSMYGVKLALERTLLFFVRPNFAAEASLNLTYTDRRVSDATVLLANNNSTKGLSYLSAQITSTTKVIDRAQNQVMKKKIAIEYIAKLKDVNVILEEQKQITIVDTQPRARVKRVITGSEVSPTVAMIQRPIDITPSPTPSVPATASEEITLTQTSIQQSIEALEEIVRESDRIEKKDGEEKKDKEDKKYESSDTRSMNGETESDTRRADVDREGSGMR